jgi:hypothetical protein
MIPKIKVLAIPENWRVSQVTKDELKSRIDKAMTLGREAHRAGKSANKAQDIELRKLYTNLTPKEATAVMKAWDRGWLEEHVKRD